MRNLGKIFCIHHQEFIFHAATIVLHAQFQVASAARKMWPLTLAYLMRKACRSLLFLDIPQQICGRCHNNRMWSVMRMYNQNQTYQTRIIHMRLTRLALQLPIFGLQWSSILFCVKSGALYIHKTLILATCKYMNGWGMWVGHNGCSFVWQV